ncbi:hypothetical protein [Denitratisoma oestradiolicum]|nr:hypothetical protein [Denitratisoma oestradiolicum]
MYTHMGVVAASVRSHDVHTRTGIWRTPHPPTSINFLRAINMEVKSPGRRRAISATLLGVAPIALLGTATGLVKPAEAKEGDGRSQDMGLKLKPLGTLALHTAGSWSFNGPIWNRSATEMKRVEWNCELFKLKSLWANGTYQKGPSVAQVNVRVLLEDADGIKLFLDYLVRTDMPLHMEGKHPVIMSGRIEVDDAVEKYRWLNRTQVVGKGYLNKERNLQTYEMYALAWD